MSAAERHQRIIDWCHEVPTRYEREDPFADDGFEEAQAAARHSCEDPDVGAAADYPPDLPPRPPARLDFARPDTPMHGSSASSKEPSASDQAHSGGGAMQRLSKVLGLFGRRRKDRREAGPPFSSGAAQPTPAHPPQLSLPARAMGYYPDVYGLRRTTYETYVRERVYAGRPVTAELQDTSGAPDLSTVERLASMPWDAVFLCFDLGNKISLLTIVQWADGSGSTLGARGFNAQTQGFDPLVHVVGMKRDLRRDCFRGLNCPGALCHSCCVSPSDATANARSIRAHDYVEVSAKTGENVHRLLDDAGEEATRRAIARAAAAAGPSRRRRGR